MWFGVNCWADFLRSLALVEGRFLVLDSGDSAMRKSKKKTFPPVTGCKKKRQRRDCPIHQKEDYVEGRNNDSRMGGGLGVWVNSYQPAEIERSVSTSRLLWGGIRGNKQKRSCWNRLLYIYETVTGGAERKKAKQTIGPRAVSRWRVSTERSMRER